MFCNARELGSKQQFPYMTFERAGGNGQDFHTPSWYQNLNWFWYQEDFLYDVFDIDESPLGTYDQSAAGTPTLGLVADGTGGQFQILLTNDDQASAAGLRMGDNLYIQGNLPFIFATRLKVVHTMAANEILWWGLGSDIALDPDTMTRNLIFRLETDTDLMIEADDNTTDSDDLDTGIDLVADTFYWFGLERTRDGAIFYHVADGDGDNVKTVEFAKRFSVAQPSFGANNLQPMIIASKASGTTVPQIIVDFLGFAGARS